MRGFRGFLRFVAPADPDGRALGRVGMEPSLQCNLGRVVDCNASGLRIRRRLPFRRDRIEVRLWDAHAGVACESVVVWRRRYGWFQHEMGLLLAPIGNEDLAVLFGLILRHRNRLGFASKAQEAQPERPCRSDAGEAA